MINSGWLPQVFSDYGGTWTNLKNKLYDNYNFFLNKIKDLRYSYTPERTQSIDMLGENVGAYISIGDTDRDKVAKVQTAFYTHKNLPVFVDIYKPFIDNVLGGDSSVYKGNIFLGAFRIESSTIQTNATLEYNIYDPTKDEQIPKGAIYIDLNVEPTHEQLERIVTYLQPLIPVYYNIYLGLAEQFEPTPFVLQESPLESAYLLEVAYPSVNNFKVIYFFST
jgi:hypothetical protein